MTTAQGLSGYLDDLGTALELRGATAETVQDVVRQVRSHAWETGEDPRQEFGSPDACARAFLPGRSTAPFWTLVLVSVALTVGGASLALQGVFGLVRGRTVLGGIPPWWAVGGGLLAIGAWIVLLARQVRRR